MFSKEQQRILGFPMSRIQRGIGALLEDMKRRGVPIPREFQGMVGMPVISESFQDFLQSTSLPLQGGKRKTRKTRKTRKGGSRGSLVLKCLLFVTQYYVFGEVFQLAKQSMPSTNIVHAMNRLGVHFTSTNAYIALLSGLMVSMMVNLGMILNKRPTIPKNSGRIEVLVNSPPKTQGGTVSNLYERFQAQMATVQAIPMDKVHAILVHVLQNLQSSSQKNLVAAIEASLGPVDRLIEQFSKPVGGTVGQLMDNGKTAIQGGAMHGAMQGGVHGLVYTALFFILFVFGGGKHFFNAALQVGNYENRTAGIEIRKLYTLPWIGEAHLADSELYMIGLVGCFLFYGFLVGWMFNKFEVEGHEDEDEDEEEEEEELHIPRRLPAVPQGNAMNLQTLIEELERIPNEEWNEETENEMNRILDSRLPEPIRNAITRKSRNVLLRRVNAINQNFSRGAVTRRNSIPKNAVDLIMYEPVMQNMPMVNFQGELGFKRPYSWSSFKKYATSKVGLITNPVTKRRIRRTNLEPYLANMVNRKNGKNKTE